MVFDQTGPACQFKNFIVTQTRALTLRFDYLASASTFSVKAIDHLHFFRTDTTTHNRPRTGFQSWFENDPLIGSRHTLYDRFAEAPCTIDHNDVAETRFSVEREHYA